MSQYSPFPPEYGFQPEPQYPEPVADAPAKERDMGMKLVAYGGSYAFQCQQTATMGGWQTVQFESAPKNRSSPSDRSYNWGSKIAFQITDTELPLLIAVLFGFIPAIRFDLHGAEKNKWMEIVNQGKSMFFKAGMASAVHVAPVSLTESSMFGLLALNQYTANFPLLTSDTVLSSVKILAKQAFDAGDYKTPRPSQNASSYHR